jgi:two-component system response regulator ChvI
VNNDSNIAASLRMLLESEQFEVRTYSNTSDALELIENPADLALIDKTNPPLGGLELYRRIRARHAMPVIFLSAWAEEIEDELRRTGMEAQGYIPLPFSRSSVVALVRKALSDSNKKWTNVLSDRSLE